MYVVTLEVIIGYMHCAGKTEDRVDMLRSILAQMEFCYRVCKWDSEGVPFRTHLYVPEVHAITKEYFLEREDEGHVFKVIGKLTLSPCTIHIIMHDNIHVHILAHTCIHVYMPTLHTCAYVYVHTHVYMPTNTCGCMCACMCA
jgi:hypothetical protein